MWAGQGRRVQASPCSNAGRYIYHSLGIFPEYIQIPESVIARLWRQMAPGLSAFDCDELLTDLVRRALIERESVAKTVTLHDLLHDYTREKLDGRLPATHLDLLTAYNPDGKPWSEIAHDSYIYNHLAYHLLEAGRREQLQQLLVNFDWLYAKLEATDVNALLADYDFLPDDTEVRLVQGAIRLSAHILARDKTQLRSQLCARLMTHQTPQLRTLVEQARQKHIGPWLRLLTPTLTPAEGPLLRTLTGHRKQVRTVAVTPDGRHLISGCNDRTLKVWELQSGQALSTLAGHRGTVNAVALTPDGRHLISASTDQTLKVWELQSKEVIASFIADDLSLLACAVAPDGMTIVTDDQSGQVHFLKLEGVLSPTGGRQRIV